MQDYKREFLDKALQFLWGKWSQLGVYGVLYGRDDSIIDPEAVIIFTLEFSRYDPRLFDEVLDWLVINGKWISVRRLRAASEEYSHFDNRVLATVCEILQGYGKQNKWKHLLRHLAGKPELSKNWLFRSKEEVDFPVTGEQDQVFGKYGLIRDVFKPRGMSTEVPMDSISTLLFQLRSLFGLSARSEIIAYLLSHEKAYPSRIARDLLYSQKGIQDALVEMTSSGLIEARMIGREKNYILLNRNRWLQLLGFKAETEIRWINWLPLFDTFSKIFKVINEPGFESKSPYVQIPKLKPLVKAIREVLIQAGYEIQFCDDKKYSGEGFEKFFVEDMEKVWEIIMGTEELDRSIGQASEGDITAFIDSNVLESDTLEYKGDCYPERKGNIEIARDITVFANKKGGRIIIGISEEGNRLIKTPIDNPAIESQRIRQVSQSSIEPRIKGLDIQRVSAGTLGNKGFIIIRVPESEDRPHAVTTDGKQEFWIRDDATKVRMDQRQLQDEFVAREKRNALKYAEIASEVDDGIQKRIEHTKQDLKKRRIAIGNEVGDNLALSLCCTPILPLNDKVPTAKELSNFHRDETLKELLRRPPDDRYGGWVVGRTDDVIAVGESLIAKMEGHSRLELHLNGTFEFVVQQEKDAKGLRQRLMRSSYGPEDVMLLYPWPICEYPWSFFMLAKRIYEHLGINDDVLIQAQLWNINDVGLGRYAEAMIGYSSDKARGFYANRYTKGNHLPIGPVLFEMPDFIGQNVSKFVTEIIYREFGYDKPGMIDEDGNLRLNIVM